MCCVWLCSATFDYETRQVYSNLSVVAVDKGMNVSDPASITININNINDNSPVFNQSVYGLFPSRHFCVTVIFLLHTLHKCKTLLLSLS